jgi:antitoxin HicB
MLAYPIKVAPDDNDTFLVTCPDLPEVTTFGKSKEEAQQAALGAIEEAIAARISYGEPIPAPVPAAENAPGRNMMFVKLPAMISLKLQLYIMMRQDCITRAELSRRLGWYREQVDRLFRLDHASRLDQIEAAFKALDRELDVTVLRHSPTRHRQSRKTALPA